jgi:hypothetical protein
LIVDRYIAAVDRNGVISTGHAALESPEGIYISLYPGVEIDRSPDDFARLLRATSENDVPGVFQPDYQTESKAWWPSTVQVRIRNYDPARLRRFWDTYRQDTTYNLTHRNCSSTVSRALEAAIEGASARVWGDLGGWRPFLRVITTPELWVAAQLRKRDDGMDAGTDARLRACVQHARRSASVWLGEDGARRRTPNGAVEAGMARRGA